MKRNLHIVWLTALFALLLILTGCGRKGTAVPAAQETVSTEQAAPAAEPAGEQAAPETSKVANASQMTTVEEVGTEGMKLIFADAVKDGTYPIAVDCSSSMFKIASCELIVADGAMTAKLTMSSDSYGYLYAGTAAAAAGDPRGEAGYIVPTVENGAGTFLFPVAALDQPTGCAAWSRNKELWYDRTLVFRSDSLPLDAFTEGTLVTVDVLGLADGQYLAEVSLGGGSGKASVRTPAELWVEDGQAFANIYWSSANYDYMIVDGVRYDADYTQTVSGFLKIPVAAFDRPLRVIADTTAMSQPHEIEYTLTFDSATLKSFQW